DLFSERRRQILQRMAQLGTAGARAAQVATLDTRTAKSCEHGLSPEELAARAAAVGFHPQQLDRLLGVPTVSRQPDTVVANAFEELAGPDGLCAHDTVVDLRDAICGFANALPGGARAADVDGW